MYTKEEAIAEVCGIVGIAYKTIGDFSHSSDCFCNQCRVPEFMNYSNDGKAIAYVYRAVVEQLKRDGYTIDPSLLWEHN